MQVTADSNRAGFRRRFTSDFDDRVDEFKSRLMRYRIPTLTLTTTGHVGRQARDQLGRKMSEGRVSWR